MKVLGMIFRVIGAGIMITVNAIFNGIGYLIALICGSK